MIFFPFLLYVCIQASLMLYLKWQCQVALTEKWAETYKNKGIGFYSMHPGWAETPGVAKSLPSFSEK